MVAAVLRERTPAWLVDSVRLVPGGDETAIVTRDGKRYVAEVWKEAAKLVAQHVG
jgi:hypothetical protein